MQNRISLETFDHWHQAICRDFSTAQFSGEIPSHLAARLSVSEFGGVAHGDSTLVTDLDLNAERSRLDVRRDPRDPFSVMLVRHGEVTVQQDDRIVRGVPGDLFMYDHGRPFHVTLHGAHQVATLGLPRGLLETRMTNPSRQTARAVTAGTPAGALAVAMIDQFGALGTLLDSEAMERLGASLLDVLALSFEGERWAENADSSRGRRRIVEAQRYMRAHLADPDITIDSIAKAIGIPARTLNRLFAAEGVTPMRWLWRQRLVASHDALASGKVVSVTDAALNFGFTDLPHFSRVFKTAFGRTPSSVKVGSRRRT